MSRQSFRRGLTTRRSRILGSLVLGLCVIALAGLRVRTQGANRRPSDSGGWPLHSLDISGSRYSPLDRINRSNAKTLGVRWSFDLPQGETAAAETPVVADGVLYFNSGSKLFALDAATGQRRWTAEIQPAVAGGGRGPAYGGGRVYALARTTLFAVDAKTGARAASFGDNGVLRIINAALEVTDPGKYPADLDPATLGYSLATPPIFHDGTLYVGVGVSDSLIPGGLLIAADAGTGAIRWVFRTVPQGPRDQGWEIAKDTWGGTIRPGGGIWVPPVIDPDLGIIYANVGNPTPNYDASSRPGINLFTNALIALNLKTGKLLWYFQTIHHDMWDWDLASGPTLFDVMVEGRTVKAIGALPKNCYVYIFNRESGVPLNPIVETPVPTKTDIPGEEPWPTQPIPYTSRGIPQQPYCAIYPRIADPELARRARPVFHPYQAGEFVITSPGNQGGPNYGPPSFSPRTRLFYVTGKNDAYSIKVKPLGRDLPFQGPGARGHFGLIAEVGPTGVTPSQNVAAIEPGTGNLAWVTELPGVTGTGSFVTAGDVLVQAVGRDLYVLDAVTGAQLYKTTLKSPTRATPMTYEAGGRQFIAMMSGSSLVALGLDGKPPR